MPIANDVSGYKWHNSLFRYAQASPGSGVGEVGFIRARMACTPYQPNARPKSIRCRVEAIQQLNGAATAEAPRVSGEEPPFMISNGDPAVIPAGFVNMLDDRGPDDALGWIVRLARFASRAQYCAYFRSDRLLVAADNDNGGGAVAGDVGAGSVGD